MPQMPQISLISLEVVIAAFLLFLMLKPALIKNPVWFKLAAMAFALRLVAFVLWVIFLSIPATARVFTTISTCVNQALLGLTIVFAVMGQVGSIANVAAEAKGKKPKADA